MICPDCKVELSTEEFKTKTGRLSASCKDCRQAKKDFNKYHNYYEMKAGSYLSTDRKKMVNGKLEENKNPIDGEWIKRREFDQKRRCTFCDRQFDNHNEDHGQAKNPDQLSVDRIDSSIPHTKDNCHLTCWRCNRMKGDMDIIEFVQHMKITSEALEEKGFL